MGERYLPYWKEIVEYLEESRVIDRKGKSITGVLLAKG